MFGQQWPRKDPPPPNIDCAFLEVAFGEFYRALGPKNCTTQTQLEFESKNNQLTVYIQEELIDGFTQTDKNTVLSTNPLSLAPHLALMYLSEEYNLAPEKLDPNQGVRRDFRTSWIDFMRPKGYPSRHTIHPVDLGQFPFTLIAKFKNVLSLTPEELKTLGKPEGEFVKSVHQYFLKALLFDKAQVNQILSKIAVPRSTTIVIKNNGTTPTIESKEDEPFSTPIIDKFSTYVEQRFNQLKIALVQIPAFRKNVFDNFNNYKENIKNELKDYDPRINLNIIEQKLDDLYRLICLCDQPQEDIFADYKNQMQLVSSATDENTLYALMSKQVNALYKHLNDKADQELLDILENTVEHMSDFSINIQIEMLFYTDQFINRKLIEKEKNILSPLNDLLYECILHAGAKKNEGYATQAQAYMKKINALQGLLNKGIEEKADPKTVATQMIDEINKPDSTLDDHVRFFSKIIYYLLNIFFKLNLDENGTTALFTTDRIRKLSNVVTTVREMPATQFHLLPMR